MKPPIYCGDVESMILDTDEDGFYLLVRNKEGQEFTFRVQVDVLADLRRDIGTKADDRP